MPFLPLTLPPLKVLLSSHWWLHFSSYSLPLSVCAPLLSGVIFLNSTSKSLIFLQVQGSWYWKTLLSLLQLFYQKSFENSRRRKINVSKGTALWSYCSIFWGSFSRLLYWKLTCIKKTKISTLETVSLPSEVVAVRTMRVAVAFPVNYITLSSLRDQLSLNWKPH